MLEFFKALDLNIAASWASIVSLAITILSLYWIGTIRGNIVESKRKARLRQLFSEISTVPDDAVPLSKATKSKFSSLDRNLPSGLWVFWTAKSKVLRGIRGAINNGEIAAVKEAIEDYKSHCEDL